MGLFDGKAKQEAAENEILQKLSQAPILDLLIENVINSGDEEPWLFSGMSYYDSCRRTVIIEPDGFGIKWSSTHEEPYIGSDGQRRTQRVEDVHGELGYSYTKSGYLPLHSYSYDDGRKEISVDRVCCLWASIIRERLAAKMPDCKFGNVGSSATFTYSVPPLRFKDWF